MAIHSNQHGLLLISVLVEDEESTTGTYLSRSDTNREMDDHIGNDKQRCDECGMSKGRYHEKNNNIFWTVSVVEITVSSNNDEPSSSSSSYFQRVPLRWNKTKEVEKDPIDNGDVDSITPQSLRERTIHWSGTANCTFIIPLKRYDTSSSSISSPSSPSPSPSSAARTFIVSLTKNCGMMATMSNISSYNRSQYEDDIRSDEKATKTLLTRRLATLPRRAHSRPTIDPVAKVLLNYRQQRRCGDLYQAPTSVLHSDGLDSRRENIGKNNDDNNDSHDYFRGYIDVFICTFIMMISTAVGTLFKRALWAEQALLSPRDAMDAVTNQQDEDEDEDEDEHENEHENEKEHDEAPETESDESTDEEEQEQEHEEEVNSNEGVANENKQDEDEEERSDNDEGSNYEQEYDYHYSHKLQETEEPIEKVEQVDLGTVLVDGFRMASHQRVHDDGVNIINHSRIGDDNSNNNEDNEEERGKEETKEEHLDSNIDHLAVAHDDAPTKVGIIDVGTTTDLQRTKNILSANSCFETEGTCTGASLGSAFPSNKDGQNRVTTTSVELPKTTHFSTKVLGTAEGISKSSNEKTEAPINLESTTKNYLFKDHRSRESPNAEMDEVLTDKSSLNKSITTNGFMYKPGSTVQPHINQKSALHDGNVLRDNFLSNERYGIVLHEKSSKHNQRALMSPTTVDQSVANPQNYGDDIASQDKPYQGPRKRSSERSFHEERPCELSKQDNTNSTERASNQSEPVDQVGVCENVVYVNGDLELNDPNQDSVTEHYTSFQDCRGIKKQRTVNYRNASLLSTSSTVDPKTKETFVPYVQGNENENQTKVEELPRPLPKRKPRWLKELESHLGAPHPNEISRKEAPRRETGVTISADYNTKSSSSCSSSNSQRGNEILTQFSNFSASEKATEESKLDEKNGSSGNNPRCNRDMSQTSDTGESYVSTLPPDSDYMTDDDPFNFPQGEDDKPKQTPMGSEIPPRKDRAYSSMRARKQRRLYRSSACSSKGATASDYRCNKSIPLSNENENENETNSVEVVRVSKSDRRPYIKSNYVADWVPSNSIKKISQKFFREESTWEAVPDVLTSINDVPKSISLPSKKRKESSVSPLPINNSTNSKKLPHKK